MRFDVPLNRSVTLPVTLRRGGVNVLQIVTPEVGGELTGRNNRAVVSINGVRDRLRVLLVSGEPHAGERTWRNLLKSDPGVDLVHFTILRPPEKQDFTPIFELSLIAFPIRELFGEARRVRPDHLRPLPAARRPAATPTSRTSRAMWRTAARCWSPTGADFAGADEPLPVAAGRRSCRWSRPAR